jgi:tRNA pseudouridine55 synthase
VMVYDLILAGFDEAAQTARLLALTGSGTYARALATDIGFALGCGGYAAALRRTRVGMFSVDDALAPGDLSPRRYEEGGLGVLSLDRALAFMPGRELSESEARLAAHGNELRNQRAGRFRAYGAGRLLGVYQAEGERARPLAVFAETA